MIAGVRGWAFTSSTHKTGEHHEVVIMFRVQLAVLFFFLGSIFVHDIFSIPPITKTLTYSYSQSAPAYMDLQTLEVHSQCEATILSIHLCQNLSLISVDGCDHRTSPHFLD